MLLSGIDLVSPAPARPGDSRPGSFSELRIVTAAGTEISYSVEVADTTRLRTRGLMFREALPPEQGMLLLYDSARELKIWMKNTRIPLDILFIDDSGRIIRISPDAVPYSEETIPSRGKARAVLEINAGQARMRGIGEGDRVLYAPLWPAAGE